MCSSIACADAFTPGRGSASTCSMCPRRSVPRRSRSIRISRLLFKDLREPVGSRDFELVVAAVRRWLVRSPTQKRRGMAEAIALHVVVLDLADALEAQRLPREILARVPPALTAGHARAVGLRLSPFAPRMLLERALAQRRQFLDQLPPARHRERRCDADVMEASPSVVQPEQQRSDPFVLPVLVPAKSRD